MKHPLRRFNDAGIAAARAAYETMATADTQDYSDILTDDALTETLGTDYDSGGFDNRWDAAHAADDALAPLVAEGRNVLQDSGLWTWMAFASIDALAPIKLGKRKPGHWARLILDSANYQRYYRHLLAGPYYILDAHRSDPGAARSLLCTPVNAPGELVEQFASRQELIRSPGIVGAITELYLDPRTDALKRGHGGNNSSPGSARRFAMLLQQLDLTYDIQEMPTSAIIGLLPPEFDKFRTAAE